MGDPAGIGPEIIVKAFADPSTHFCQAAVVYGDTAVLQDAITRFTPNAALTIRPINHPNLFEARPNQLTLINCSALSGSITFGQVQAQYGAAAIAAIVKASEHTLAGHHTAVVTAPIHKEAIAAAGATFPGHTEMLAHLAGTPEVRMMLANAELRTVLVTIHVSLAQAIAQITTEKVLQTIVITHRALQQMGIAQPRIAVAGLNPHAGEGGLFGREEIDAIIPAVEQAKAQGINAQGPFPGDTIFAKARGFAVFDVVIAMFHDQGLIPVKYLGIDEGVNVTLGLPFIRTSVDHGTAFDIAGHGLADHRSLLAAASWAQNQINHS
jgi:4-hydroxythreonine-4-phosphate dehydrogenase